jgi:hypothetical protein
MKEVLSGIYIRLRQCLNEEKVYGTGKYACDKINLWHTQYAEN